MSRVIFRSISHISVWFVLGVGPVFGCGWRFSTPEREASAPAPAPVPSPVPEAVSEEPKGFRRYQTRMGPRAPSPVPRGELGGPGPLSGPHIGPRQVLFFSASTVTSRISYRGDILTSAVTCLTDQGGHCS